MNSFTLTGDQDDEVAFITGVAYDGTVASTSFWTWNSDEQPATYSDQSYAAKWGGSAAGNSGGVVTYGFDATSHWSAKEEAAITATLALWADVANVDFQLGAPGSADIDFVRTSSGNDREVRINNDPGPVGGPSLVQAQSATVDLATSVAGFGPLGASFSDYGGYPWESLLHEEGHALGLGHAGAYNGEINPATEQYSGYDNRAWSIMSYVEPDNSSAKYYGYSETPGTQWGTSYGDNGDTYGNDPTTWMPVDVLAIQRLYGLPTSTPLSGGQTFGFHSNIAGPTESFFDFNINTQPVITIWDEGDGNTLDLSGYAQNATVDLNPGTFSSVAGLTNNIAIAFEAAIDTVIGGSGNDALTANNDGDTLTGGPGADTLIGGAGVDSFKDTQANLSGDTIESISTGDRLVFTDASLADLSWSLTGATLNFGGGFSLTFNTGIAGYPLLGELVASADPAGGVDLTLAAPLSNPLFQDFNYDLVDDLLWRNTDGAVATWRITDTTGGYQEVQNAFTWTTTGNDWQLQGSVDFNGDGRSDILWRNPGNGNFSIWESTGAGFTIDSDYDATVAPSWTMSGFGDYNGDGKSDLFWRNISGAYSEWISTGTGFVQNVTTGFVDPSWQVAGEGDFNGDGRADLIWRNANGQFSTWVSTGLSFTQNVSAAFVSLEWHVVGVGDFDGDGKADILWRNNDGELAEWRSTGASFTQNVFNEMVDPSWHVAQIGDFNGDGKADIVWRNDNGAFTVWQSTGTGFTENVLSDNSVSTSWSVVSHPYALI